MTRPDDHEQQGGKEDPFVDAYALCHDSCFRYLSGPKALVSLRDEVVADSADRAIAAVLLASGRRRAAGPVDAQEGIQVVNGMRSGLT